jgi:hypothetical protein
VAKHKLDIGLNGRPKRGTVSMGIGNKGSGAAIEIGEEVPENMDRSFSARKRAEAHTVHVELHRTGSKAKLKAKLNGQDGPKRINEHIQFNFDPAFVLRLSCD